MFAQKLSRRLLLVPRQYNLSITTSHCITCCIHKQQQLLFGTLQTRFYSKQQKIIVNKETPQEMTEQNNAHDTDNFDEYDETLVNEQFEITLDFEKEEAKLQNLPEPEMPFDGIIPQHKLDIRYVRSSGPGGQNVNKVSTKADVRFNIDAADWLPPVVKQRLKLQQAHRVNAEGELVIQASVHRTQEQNLKDAVNRIKTMVAAAYVKPKERVFKYVRKESDNERRLAEKKHRQKIKGGRYARNASSYEW